MMTEDFNNEIRILRGPDRVRKRPCVIFGDVGDAGVRTFVTMLTSPFVTEAGEGYSRGMEISLGMDGSVEILSRDTGIILSEESCGELLSWREVFCELYPGPKFAGLFSADRCKAEHNALFGREGTELRYGTAGEISLELCCVQYACEYMQVESVRDGIRSSLGFEKGYVVSELKTEKTDEEPYTRIRCKPDVQVFGEYGSMAEVCRGILKGLAVCNGGFCAVLYDEDGTRTEYRMDKGAAEGLKGPLYRAEMTATGRDRYNLPEYTAELRVTLGFDPERKEISCYHNSRLLEDGGAHLDAALERISAFLDYRFHTLTEHKGIEVDPDYLSSRIYLVIETVFDSSALRWENAAEKAIVNSMITDMTYDLFNERFTHFLKCNEEEISKLLHFSS